MPDFTVVAMWGIGFKIQKKIPVLFISSAVWRCFLSFKIYGQIVVYYKWLCLLLLLFLDLTDSCCCYFFGFNSVNCQSNSHLYKDFLFKVIELFCLYLWSSISLLHVSEATAICRAASLFLSTFAFIRAKDGIDRRDRDNVLLSESFHSSERDVIY